jgi:predicted dehydrogenase
VSATLTRVGTSTTTADDAFVMHFETESGCAGVMQSTAADWGPPIVITRVAGTFGTAWIEGIGAAVNIADRNGTRRIDVGPDLPTGRPEPLPPGVLHTAYDRMIAHGLDLGPYTCLAAAFRDRILAARGHDRELVDDPRPATFEDGVAGMAVLDAARASARQRGAWVGIGG